ncbi:6,7-dimethyl-8-ribityllumazine synthase (riboflavin synthase beta chain) [Candidatus Blochmanniella floridana]|uniref:6,7-dimethyl-8-ribityllumazine synthase n=1 Tax=Blochmanniella floridana TaxID=203907 RepID=RISB_BLOFL|nr:RecName: Full=6,7-dimethyl-8-ribityllumazine synthase; Short=DMRL synthase; Short=LS; Short=Lumazine synthase [Candidatus Blochmannia floridanus]CAD83306.1 6,7-dimethyl-8-ribityllumazine synthase (riboflavin synthase beta chain) [Candidatus Blochmannia floridanus]
MDVIEGNTVVSNITKIVVVVARFNKAINNHLLEGTIDTLKRVGQVQDENITIVWVPGAYELPLVSQALSISNKYDAIIVLGTIIRGITEHFEFIYKSCNFGLSNISISNLVPIGLGLLVTNDIGQAVERIGIKGNNKGSEAALAALEMINILKTIKNNN